MSFPFKSYFFLVYFSHLLNLSNPLCRWWKSLNSALIVAKATARVTKTTWRSATTFRNLIARCASNAQLSAAEVYTSLLLQHKRMEQSSVEHTKRKRQDKLSVSTTTCIQKARYGHDCCLRTLEAVGRNQILIDMAEENRRFN